MRALLSAIILPLASAVLRKYQPIIVAVTGTVGKTTTKNAIACAIAPSLSVRASEKNNNTELGAAVTILGRPSGGRSVLSWLMTMYQGLALLWSRDRSYPRVLVLEYAMQQAGDVEKLCNLFPPTVGVLTSIGATHASYFPNGIDGVAAEKSALVAAIPEHGVVVLNADDARVMQTRQRANAKRVITYGLQQGDVRGSEPTLLVYHSAEQARRVDGIQFSVTVAGETYPVLIDGVLGTPPVAATCAALAVVHGMHLPVAPAVKGMQHLASAKGHLRLIPGIKYTVLIDDTYNASTKSMEAALQLLAEMPSDDGEQRIAVLGEMREMGNHTDEEHEKVGRAVAEYAIDRLIAVGEKAQGIVRGARAAGLAEEKISFFTVQKEAGKFVQRIMEKGDTVLIKGSRGMHMERMVKELMAEPLRAEELLEFGEPTT